MGTGRCLIYTGTFPRHVEWQGNCWGFSPSTERHHSIPTTYIKNTSGFFSQWKKMESHLQYARSPLGKIWGCPIGVQSWAVEYSTLPHSAVIQQPQEREGKIPWLFHLLRAEQQRKLHEPPLGSKLPVTLHWENISWGVRWTQPVAHCPARVQGITLLFGKPGQIAEQWTL